ncbi:hypothetical protein [Actinomadura atramentaria]|uniref:hypothetical protein n=1 Tax=Actinomadura atramentaria TaxID=1990 RepID=UPI00035F1334|nr:hypothetical protein [Actinomadura atramentaria]
MITVYAVAPADDPAYQGKAPGTQILLGKRDCATVELARQAVEELREQYPGLEIAGDIGPAGMRVPLNIDRLFQEHPGGVQDTNGNWGDQGWTWYAGKN